MYMGGGILGGANAVAMSDDDGDGIWTVTIEISTDQIGGKKKLAYGNKRLKKILLSHEEIDDSIANLLEDFKLYQGHNTRRDDLSVAAFSITQ